MTRGLLCFAATATVLLAGASAARATTITYTPACPKALCAPELRITAAAGERNNLVFSAGEGRRWRIAETTGVALAGPSDVCTAITPSVMSCAAAELQARGDRAERRDVEHRGGAQGAPLLVEQHGPGAPGAGVDRHQGPP